MMTTALIGLFKKGQHHRATTKSDFNPFHTIPERINETIGYLIRINSKIAQCGNLELIKLKRAITDPFNDIHYETGLSNSQDNSDISDISAGDMETRRRMKYQINEINRIETNLSPSESLKAMSVMETTKSSLCYLVNSKKAHEIVESEYKEYANYLFEALVVRDNEDEIAQIQRFLIHSLKVDKKNASIYNMIFNLKIYGELFKVAMDRMNHKEFNEQHSRIRDNLLNIFSSQENIHFIFKLLCDS